MKKYLSYEISAINAFKEFKRNEEFREFLKGGNFIHCEDRMIINHPKYIKFNEEGVASLTDYAKENEQECCIQFTITEAKKG